MIWNRSARGLAAKVVTHFDRTHWIWDRIKRMSQALVEVPDSAPLALRVKPGEVGRELLLAAAVKL